MASAAVETNYALRGPAPTFEELEEQLRNLVSAYDALTAAPAKAAAPKRPAAYAAAAAAEAAHMCAVYFEAKDTGTEMGPGR